MLQANRFTVGRGKRCDIPRRAGAFHEQDNGDLFKTNLWGYFAVHLSWFVALEHSKERGAFSRRACRESGGRRRREQQRW